MCWIPVGSKYVPTEEARDLFLGEVLLLDWRWPPEQGEFCRGAPPEAAREIARLIRIFEFPLTVGVAWGRWYEGMPLYGAIGRFWHGDAKLVAVHGPEGVVPVFAENPPPAEDEDEDEDEEDI